MPRAFASRLLKYYLVRGQSRKAKDNLQSFVIVGRCYGSYMAIPTDDSSECLISVRLMMGERRNRVKSICNRTGWNRSICSAPWTSP